MIAPGVVTRSCAVKVTALVAFMIALAVFLYPAWAFGRRRLYEHEKKLALRCRSAARAVLLGSLSATSSCSAGCSRSSRLRAEVDHAGTDIERISAS